MPAVSVPVDPATLALFPQALMSDAYRLIVDEEALDALTAASRMFGRMPWWMRVLMAMRNRLVAPLGLKTGRDKAIATSPPCWTRSADPPMEADLGAHFFARLRAMR